MTGRRMLVAASVLVAVGLVVGAIAQAGGPPADAKYVGADKCKACHAKQHKTWSAEKHSKAFDALQGDEAKNPKCVKCHVTGFGLPGGFTDAEKTANMKNVQCEACHGPGSAHVEAAKAAPETGEWDKKNNKIPQNVCVNCHNPHVNQKEEAEKSRKK